MKEILREAGYSDYEIGYYLIYHYNPLGGNELEELFDNLEDE